MSLAWISVGALVLAVILSCTTTINVCPNVDSYITFASSRCFAMV